MVGGTDAGAFMIDGGVLRFKKAPDYEIPADIVGADASTAAANDNTYEVMVTAMDSTGETGEKPVNVKVMNLDEMARWWNCRRGSLDPVSSSPPP